MADLQKSGYLEVKEPSNIKGRKLKTWKHKWVVLQEMSNLASGTLAAKLELYPTEASAINKSSDKMTYLLENVTAIEPCQSKTHKLAFQIVTDSPTLVLCADCEYTTNVWITRLKKIFSPNQDSFSVEILQNADSKKFSLTGQYRMGVSPEAVTIYNSKNNEKMGWRLETLKRFYMDKNKNDTLVIESGAKAECGEAKFEFRSRKVADILTAIKNNIQIAINERRQAHSQSTSVESRSRTLSTSSFEQGFQSILINSEKTRTSSIGNASNASTESNETSASKGNSEISFKIIGDTGTQKPRSASLNERKVNDSNVTPYATISKLPANTRPRLSGHYRASSLDSSPFQSSEALNDSRDVESRRPNSCDIQDRRRISSEYDTLHVERNRKPHEIDIVSKMRLTSPENKEIEVAFDRHGYSHVTPLKANENNETAEFQLESNNSDVSTKDVKLRMRTVSGNSVESKRSCSVGSHDSGVSSLNTGRIIEQEEVSTCREGSSFDSAISTDISVTVSEAIVVSSSESEITSRLSRSCSHPSSSSLDSKSQLAEVEAIDEGSLHMHSKHNRSKSDPAGYDLVEKESEYEELDKYRKDIKQFLGMDKNIKPDQVPPSLPERPSTMPAKRKQTNKRKKKVSFPLISRKDKNNRNDSLSSTSSDEEDSPTVGHVASVSAWPLEKQRVQNSLYESTEHDENQRQAHEIVSSSSAQPASTDSSTTISSMSRWPLAMTAKASCNRFYSSSNEMTNALKKNTTDSEPESRIGHDTADKFKDDDHIYASVESKPIVDDGPKPFEDLLTGEETYLSSSILPVIQPVPVVPISNVDLLTGDLLGLETATTSTLVSEGNANFPTVLDQLVPVADETQFSLNVNDDLFASNENDETFNEDGRGGQIRMRRKGEVINPFPNLARYSGPIEDLLREDNIVEPKSLEFEPTRDSSYVNMNSDPFDIFHIGVISSNMSMSKSASDSTIENTYTNQIVADQSQEPKGLSRSASDQLNTTTDENPYMAMTTKDKEDEYVSPSTLK
ncbi:hypothetical protein FSP39_002799 [Pinctada imbricata]|uniref:Protein chico n=1 Tax=Pinctada imbricata TaxID=66713 RepID=A0AA88XQ24_PINIB|nr:hypothetical protein FSP39_002799 [Pinctada imbricata]